MRKLLNIIYLFPLISLTLWSCSSESALEEKKIGSEEVSESSKHNIEEARNIFYMMPSPIETASIIQKSGAVYDKTILNPIENVVNYETTSSKAFNLGVYGSDLSVASVFDQTQEAMFFISNCKNLSDALGISEAFDAESLERIEANINDKDSLLYLISDTYLQTDAYLQENDLAGLSALIMAGGWIEGLYVAIKLQEQSKSADLRKRIAEQKYSLHHLLEILKTYKDDQKISAVFLELDSLNLIFNKIKTVKTEPKAGKNVIGSSNELQLSDEILLELANKTGQIRNNYINR